MGLAKNKKKTIYRKRKKTIIPAKDKDKEVESQEKENQQKDRHAIPRFISKHADRSPGKRALSLMEPSFHHKKNKITADYKRFPLPFSSFLLRD